MKKYFAELEALGHKTIADLRTHDAGAASMLADLEADLRAGLITQKGLANHRQAMADKRMKILKDHQEAVAKMREEYEAAIDKAYMPTASCINSEDAETLKYFDLSPAEFEKLAEKYAANPSMCRLLEQYRVQHEGQPYGPKSTERMLGTGEGQKKWHTDWKFQTADERKKIFERACGTVDSYIGQRDKYSPNRELNLSRYISGAFHSLQGSDPDALPAPELPQEKPRVMPKVF